MWLYFKIYGGVRSLDRWIGGSLPSLVATAKMRGWISQFHFIRYLDPDFHIRFRMKVIQNGAQSLIEEYLHKSLETQITAGQVWKIQREEYQPETERFGPERILLVEEWFDQDSQFWTGWLSNPENLDLPDRWRVGLQRIDGIFSSFRLGKPDRLKIVSRMSGALTSEFRLSGRQKSAIGIHYNQHLNEILNLLEKPEQDLRLLPAASQIISTFPSQNDFVDSNLLPDLIHLSMNRCFRARHRQQELVLYEWLRRFYSRRPQ